MGLITFKACLRILILIVVSANTGCGGGGGGSSSSGGGTTTTPSAPVTVTCPNGTSSTAASTAAANAACPAPALVSISPVNGDTTVSPDTFTSITVVTDSQLDPTSITTGNITLKIGSLTNITGTVAVVGTNGFKFTPAAKLSYIQAYNFAANVKDTLGKTLAISTTFTTTVLTCTPPARVSYANTCVSPPSPSGYTWNDIIKAWVADIGVLVTGANTLPAACVTVGDACWLASVADGTIKFVNSGVVMTGANTRPIVFAYYLTASGNWVTMPMYADVLATSPAANQNVNNGGGSSIITDIKGSANGVKKTVPAFGCFEEVYGGGVFVNNTTTCPI